MLGLLFGTIDLPENILSEFPTNNIKDQFYRYLYFLLGEHGIKSALGFICLLVALGTILKNSTRYFALYCLTPIRNNVIRDIRKDLYFKLLRLPLKTINKFKKGDLVARMTNDLTEIEWSIMGVLELFIKDPIHIIIFLTSLIYISPELTLISFLFLPITGFIITKISKSLKQSSRLSQDKIGDLISLIEESITNLKIIKVLDGYRAVTSGFNKENESLKQINNSVLWRKDLASPMSEMLSTLVMVLIIWFGGKIVLSSSLEAASFIGFLVIFSQIIPPVKSLTTAFYSIQKGSAAVDRILKIIEFKTDNERELKGVQIIDQGIVYKDLFFKYGDEVNLKSINLDIKKGQKVAIVGESGSGKSTLIELLLKLHRPTSGTIYIDGEDINNININSLFSFVTQDVLLFNDTILNNLLLGNHQADLKEVKRATKKANIHNVINALEDKYNTIIGPQGNSLSGGERQRLSVARALLSKAPVLIFDEPTSALDKESHNYIQETFKKLDKEKTIITVTHKLSSIIDYDIIIVMQNGTIIEQGPHKFLLNKAGVYKKLYELETSLKK